MTDIETRNIERKCLLNTAEAMALESLSKETGFSYSALLRFGFLKLLDERHEQTVLDSLGVKRSTGTGQ